MADEKRKRSHTRHESESSSAEEEDSNQQKRHHKHKHKKDKLKRRHRADSEEGHHSRDFVNGSGERHRGSGDGHENGRSRLGDNRHHNSDSDNQRHTEENGAASRSRHRKHRRRRGGSAEFDPNLRIKQEKDDRNFRDQQRDRGEADRRRREHRRERDRTGGDHGLNTDGPVIVKSEPGMGGPPGSAEGDENNQERQQPNFELSGKLTEDTNTFRGVVIKYNEPPEAMKPKRRWRLYPFKGQESLPVLHIHRQSAFLLGRDRRIADIPVDHPSCSKQQAVLQFRAMPYERPDGTPGRRVRPYIIDLESANGTYLNGEKMDARRYYELREKDVIKFGFSSREYVILHDAVDVSEVAAGEDMEEA